MVSKFDIFFSYQADSKELVKLFYKKFMANFSYKIYFNELLDESDVKEDDLLDYNEKINEIINRSKCFLCFITQKYIQSERCKNEVFQAAKTKLHIFMLKLEAIELKSIDDLNTINPLATFNIFDLNENEIFSSKVFSLLLNSVQQLFKIKSYLLSDSSKSSTYLKDRPMSPLPPSGKMPGFDETKPIEYDDGTRLSTEGKFMLLANGDCYNGKFLNKKYFGFGHYKWSNGDSYEGDWFE